MTDTYDAEADSYGSWLCAIEALRKRMDQMLTADDLRPFCSTDKSLPYLHYPWSRDWFTYATNGHILIKIERLPGMPDNPKAPNADQVFNVVQCQTVTAPLPDFEIPEAGKIGCELCGGSGKEYSHLDGVNYDCEPCDGTGTITELISVTLFGTPYAAHYIKLLRALPGFQLSTNPPSLYGPSRFVFDGGEGAIMPLRHNYDRHIEVQV
jgi:hypothetical protein